MFGKHSAQFTSIPLSSGPRICHGHDTVCSSESEQQNNSPLFLITTNVNKSSYDV